MMTEIGTLRADGWVIRASDGACVPPDPDNIDYRQIQAELADGGTLLPWEPPPVDFKAYAANKRWQVETGGISVGGAEVGTTRDDQAMITGAFTFAQANPSATIDFKAATGWITLTAEQMTAIGNAVGAHVQACFAAEKAIDADINSGMITTSAQIDSDRRWPA